MTPAERAVIDAARAWAADYSLSENVSRLLAAVRALPRPLSEQLADLRVGAVVEDYNQSPCKVLANLPDLWLLVVEVLAVPYCPREVRPYNGITRIISNPEASNG